MDHEPFDLVTSPSHPGDLLDPHLFGTPFCPAHKSHLLSWLRCPRAFYLRSVRGFTSGTGRSAPWFAVGKLYHKVLQLAADHPDLTHDKLYSAALEATSASDKIALNKGSLSHAAILARQYAGKITGHAELTWLVEIEGFWFAGSYDNVQDGQPGTITDYKTDHGFPTQHECDYGPESVIYRLAYRALRGTLPRLRYLRLSQHWATRKQATEISTDKPIPRQAIEEVLNLVRQIRNLSITRHFSSDCKECPVATLCMKPDNLLPESRVCHRQSPNTLNEPTMNPTSCQPGKPFPA